VGPLFGAVIAGALDTWWDRVGPARSVHLRRLWRGQRDAGSRDRRAAPRCLDALEIVLVERSPVLRRRHPQARAGRAATPFPTRASNGVVFANELLDNLPFDCVSALTAQWRDVVVDVDADGELCDRPAGDRGRAADHYAAIDWFRGAIDLVQRGRVVVIDYATTTDEMCERNWREWVRTYREHERGDHPLTDPGSQDITVDVAFDQLAAIRAPNHDRAQHEFLRNHGIDELVAEGQQIWTERAHLGDLAH
jgi:SAM-dependent MidA family methyltransferase